MGLPDYHTHTGRCGHGEGSATEYVVAAQQAGLSALGVSDHLPVLHTQDPDLSMGLDQLQGYIDEVLELKRRYPGYVLLGIEAHYRPDTIEQVKGLLAAHPFDYVIGSVHFIGDWGFDDPREADHFESRGVDDAYRSYYEAVREAVACGAFTILGHLDLVKKFGYRTSLHLDETIDKLGREIAHQGMIVEVNTAGLHKPVGELYPSAEILARLRRCGVSITFGSDAHAPAHVGRDFERAVEAARSAGYTHYARLDQQSPGQRVRPRAVPLRTDPRRKGPAACMSA